MFIDIHTHHERTNQKSIVILDPRDIPEKLPQLHCLGIHPWYIQSFPEIERFLETFLVKNQIFALGEIGIDKAIETDIKVQKAYFKTQVEMAVKYKTPRVIIHSVRAYQEIFEILKEIKYSGKILFHDFNSTIEMAQQLLLHFDCYFSFGHKIKDSTSKAAKTLSSILIEKVFFETDDQPDLEIREIYQHAAGLLRLSISKLEDQVEINFKEFSK